MTPCTTTTNASITTVISDIEERASRVRSLMENSASIWLEVAREVEDAKKHLSKSDYELFLSKSALSRPIADKLLSVAKARILYRGESKEYLDKLEGWTTLYEVAKLSENEIRELFKSIDDNSEQALTRSYIAQFNSKRTHQLDRIEIVATITLSTDKIRQLSRTQFQRFESDLDQIRQIISRSVQAAEFDVKANKMSALEALVYNPTSVSDVNAPLTEAVGGELQSERSVVDSISTITH